MTLNYNEIFNKVNDLFSKADYTSALEILNNINEPDKKLLDFKYKMLFNILQVCEKEMDNISILYCLYEMEKIKPDNENLLLNIALTLEHTNDFASALLYYEKILNINKRNYDALIHIAILFAQAKQFKNALSYIEKAKRVKPNQYKTAYAYFKVYEGDFKFKEAVKYAKEMIYLKPDSADGYYNCARTYYHLFDYKKSIEYCDKLLNFEPDNINILCLKIECLSKTDKSLDIASLYEKLIEKYPNSYTIKRIYSSYELQNKNYEKAMENYMYLLSGVEMQKDRGDVAAKYIEYSKKQWKRDDVSDKTVLIYQGALGLGDYLMFSRYIPEVEKKAKRVIVEVNENLYDLFKHNFKKSDVIIENKNEVIKEYYDYSASCMELFYNIDFGFSNIPYSEGWLNISDEKIIEAKNTGIFDRDKINVGIFWRGSGSNMNFRNVDLDKFAPLFEIEKFRFISFDIVSKDDKTLELMNKYNIVDCSEYIKNAADTGAFLKNLDLFISVDSFPLHLAGSLGVKTFLILPVLAEWRWFDDTNTTPWYNSVKIFRQTETENIDVIIQKIKNELTEY